MPSPLKAPKAEPASPPKPWRSLTKIEQAERMAADRTEPRASDYDIADDPVAARKLLAETARQRDDLLAACKIIASEVECYCTHEGIAPAAAGYPCGACMAKTAIARCQPAQKGGK